MGGLARQRQRQQLGQIGDDGLTACVDHDQFGPDAFNQAARLVQGVHPLGDLHKPGVTDAGVGIRFVPGVPQAFALRQFLDEEFEVILLETFNDGRQGGVLGRLKQVFLPVEAWPIALLDRIGHWQIVKAREKFIVAADDRTRLRPTDRWCPGAPPTG